MKSTKRPSPDLQAGAPRKPVSGEPLRQQIAEAAYFRAQQRGFAPGYEEQDWIEAEAQVRARVGLSS